MLQQLTFSFSEAARASSPPTSASSVIYASKTVHQAR